MTTEIKLLDSTSFEAWDEFVKQAPDATFCHLSGWKTVIEQGAGQSCPYVVGLQDGIVVGVLPLSIKNHFLFGKALISNMFCVYGGAVAVDADVKDRLYRFAWQLAEKHGLPIFENRSRTRDNDLCRGWVAAPSSATFVKELAEDDEQQLLAIPRKQRAVIRKSLKNGLETKWDGDFNTFYDLYAKSVLALGTPVFPKRMFAALIEVFGSDVEIQLTSSADGSPVASLMSFYFRETVMPYYAGGSNAVRSLGAHDHMYFQLMCAARHRGIRYFDFGRSKIDSGPYRFKKNWGFEPVELGYEMRLAEGADLPSVSQQSGPFAVMSRVWTRLPLGVSKILGPSISRHLG